MLKFTESQNIECKSPWQDKDFVSSYNDIFITLKPPNEKKRENYYIQ